MKTMKKLLLVAALLATIARVPLGRAEDVCVDAGAIGPVPVSVPSVCVPVP